MNHQKQVQEMLMHVVQVIVDKLRESHYRLDRALPPSSCIVYGLGTMLNSNNWIWRKKMMRCMVTWYYIFRYIVSLEALVA
jgi:hypothetical protein